jgi:cytochrome c peroxidase
VSVFIPDVEDMSFPRKSVLRGLGVSPGGLYSRSSSLNRTGFILTRTRAYNFKRGFASAPASASSPYSKWVLLLGAGAAVGGASAFFYMSENKFGSTQNTSIPTKEDYQNVYTEIARLLAEMDEYDDGSYGPVSTSISCCQQSPID